VVKRYNQLLSAQLAFHAIPERVHSLCQAADQGRLNHQAQKEYEKVDNILVADCRAILLEIPHRKSPMAPPINKGHQQDIILERH